MLWNLFILSPGWAGDCAEARRYRSIPAKKRADIFCRSGMHFEPVIETPFGATKAEVRVMYVWLEQLHEVLTIIRMGVG